jgi:hypothetical protein
MGTREMTDDIKEEIQEIVTELEEMIEGYERQLYALAMEGLIMTALNDAKIKLLMQALATIQEITDDSDIHDIAVSAVNAVKTVQYEPPAKEKIN